MPRSPWWEGVAGGGVWSDAVQEWKCARWTETVMTAKWGTPAPVPDGTRKGREREREMPGRRAGLSYNDPHVHMLVVSSGDLSSTHTHTHVIQTQHSVNQSLV